MKFVSLLATLSFVASAFAVYVTSADGTNIWAEATGNPDGPVIVFIPGFSCSSLAFSKQWDDPFMNMNLHMVRQFCCSYHQNRQSSHLTPNSFDTMFVVRA